MAHLEHTFPQRCSDPHSDGPLLTQRLWWWSHKWRSGGSDKDAIRREGLHAHLCHTRLTLAAEEHRR